jgi:hypothetical protein
MKTAFPAFPFEVPSPPFPSPFRRAPQPRVAHACGGVGVREGGEGVEGVGVTRGWQVLEAFSGPPKVVFSWRHWATFTGEYKGNKGQGQVSRPSSLPLSHHACLHACMPLPLAVARWLLRAAGASEERGGG